MNLSYSYLSKISVADINGNIVKSFSMGMIKGTNNKIIDISDLAKGVYIIKCSTAEGFINQKILKQ